MTKAQISKLVTEGLKLDTLIKTAERRLGEIKEQLKERAGGESCTLLGRGAIATVNFAAAITGPVPTEKLSDARRLAGASWKKLFCWAVVKEFRDKAEALLPTKEAQEIQTLLEGVPRPRITFTEIRK